MPDMGYHPTVKKEDHFVAWVLGFFLLASVLILTPTILYGRHRDQRARDLCTSKYGKDYYWVQETHGADFCTNEKGDLRYPKEWN